MNFGSSPKTTTRSPMSSIVNNFFVPRPISLKFGTRTHTSKAFYRTSLHNPGYNRYGDIASLPEVFKSLITFLLNLRFN